MAERVDSVGGSDRISSLPDPIICHILSFLPIKDAVKTSILSPRWRYLFASSISILDFNSCLSHMSSPTENDNNFLNFVDILFSNPKQLSLDCLRVNDHWVRKDGIPRGENYSRLNRWICAALWCGVKEIDANLMFEYTYTLPSLLFTCQTLVTLKLNINCDLKVPANVHLPNLKTLHFAYSEFLDGGSVLRLISSCPVLENLESIHCEFRNISELNIHKLSLKRLVLDFGELYVGSHRGFNVIEINAPNLVYFRYVDGMAEGYTLSEMKSLERTHIEITLTDSEDLERAANLLQGVCNVQSLYLAIEDDSKTLFLAPLDPMLAFNNLVELEFRNYLNDDWQGTWILEFLHCMPNLKTLVLDLLNLASTSEGFRSRRTTVPPCLLFNIEEIEIK
ncbi:F-box/LRR-repeat protein At3g59200-like [Hibiscus syriacus]|uniref:F-box/LRR-repeat protein At3g59200-like n=1 Tax=Hibiscus syriacus TaxID=106335 RepID=UPI001922C989|nr:F-box/LRR-repeat protein At3g59200-like [Hibiscus syriacus]